MSCLISLLIFVMRARLRIFAKVEKVTVVCLTVAVCDVTGEHEVTFKKEIPTVFARGTSKDRPIRHPVSRCGFIKRPF